MTQAIAIIADRRSRQFSDHVGFKKVNNTTLTNMPAAPTNRHLTNRHAAPTNRCMALTNKHTANIIFFMQPNLF